MNSINWRSHWAWFALLLTTYSVYDYVEHITRLGEPYGAHPFAWLGFTTASHVTLVLAAFGFAILLRKLPISTLAADTFGVCAAVALHVLASGPFWNTVFWPLSTMSFANAWLPMAFAAVAYLIYRGVFWTIRKVMARHAA